MENKKICIFDWLDIILMVLIIVLFCIAFNKIQDLDRQVKELQDIKTKVENLEDTKIRVDNLEDKTTCIELRLEDIMPNDDLP